MRLKERSRRKMKNERERMKNGRGGMGMGMLGITEKQETEMIWGVRRRKRERGEKGIESGRQKRK